VIAVDGQDIGATPRNFCQVGRSAKVVFEDAGAGAAELAPRGKTVALAREAPIAPAR
jgi:hypothetical protein